MCLLLPIKGKTVKSDCTDPGMAYPHIPSWYFRCSRKSQSRWISGREKCKPCLIECGDALLLKHPNRTICKNCSSVTLTVVREHEILKQNMQEMYRNVTLRYHGGKQTVMIDDDSDSKAPTFTCFSCFPPKYQKQILPSRDTEFACSTIISNPSIQSKTL